MTVSRSVDRPDRAPVVSPPSPPPGVARVPGVVRVPAGAGVRRRLPRGRTRRGPVGVRAVDRLGRPGVVPALVATVVALPAVASGLRAGAAGRWGTVSGLLVLIAVAAAVVPVSLRRPVDGIRGVDRTLRAHRACGWLVVALATTHTAFVLAPASVSPDLLSPATPARTGAVTAGVAAALVGALAVLSRGSSRGVRIGNQHGHRLHVVLTTTLTGATLLHLVWSSAAAGDTVTRDAVALTAGLLLIVVALRLVGARVTGLPGFVVERVRTERPGVRTLTLSRPRRGSLPNLRSGQVLGLRLDTRGGRRLPGAPRITSVANQPGCVDVALDGEDGAQPSADQLRPGRRVFADDLRDPTSDAHQGSLLLVAHQREVPLALGLLRMQVERRDRRPHCLVVTGPDRSDPFLRRELAEIGGRMDLDVIEVRSQPPLTWTGRRGRVDGRLLRQILGQYRRLPAPHAYVFGPTSLTGDVRTALRGLGLAERRIHADRIVHVT